MKILFIIDNFHIGGAQRLLVDLVSGLDREKFEPIVCVLRSAENYLDELADCGIRVVDLGKNRHLAWKLWKLLALVKRERVETVHTILPASRILGVLAGAVGGAGKIFSHDVTGDGFLQNRPYLRRFLFFPVDRFLTLFTTRIFAASRAVADFNRQEKRIPEKKLEVLYNWIDVKRFSGLDGERQKLRADWYIPSESLVVGTVGRLNAMKGHRLLIEAAPEILRFHDKVQFVIIGEGEERSSLEALARERKVEDHFSFVGFIPELDKAYRAFDLFVLTSSYDTFPLVVLEAMVSGLPVVATAVGGIPEMVDGESGILVPPGDPKALAEALCALISDPERRAVLSEGAIRNVTKRFNREESLRYLEKCYEGKTEHKTIERMPCI